MEEVPGDSGGTAAAPPEDSDILAHERDIRGEAQALPLVSPYASLDELKAQYAGNAGFLPKIETLMKSFRALRRTRPDGNCFYRAYLYGIFEQLPGSKDRQAFIAERAKAALDYCIDAGYERVAIEDFWEELSACVERLSAEGASVATADAVLEECDGYLVCWARCLTSAFLKRNQDDYAAFLTSHSSIQAFCAQEVDPMNTEADHLQITALSSYFRVPARVVYLDQSVGDTATEHCFSGGAGETGASPLAPICLLYRPGHYDLIYPL
mmetsp:Transcript_19380/g.53215  ORF Transcript_19380/g.53215 Transcript_19380/m.53215 type:complete len:268 (+) Transcript_19380:104-907(+)